MNNRFKKILNIIIFVIFLFAMTIKVDVVKAETADHKFSFTAFTCSTLDENNKCKGYKNDGVIEEFDYDNPFVSHGEVIKLGIHYTPGQNKTWDLSTFFNYDKDYVTPIYVNDSLFIEKAEDLNNLYIIDSNDITTEAQIGAIVEDGSTLEENRTYLENEEDLYYVYFKVKDVTPSTTFKFTYDLDEDKTNVSADGTITSQEIEFEIIDKYTVTYPDGKVIIKNAGDILKLPEAWDKDSEVISTVTFKYHNDLEDTTSNVTKGYTLSKWTIDETEYNPGDEITINNDIVLEDSYGEEIINAEFPENPKKPGYKFIGWYTEETGGEKVENYSEDEDIILHAQWQVMDNVHIITPDGEEEVPYGTEYTLGTNDIPKEDDTYDVTFKYHDDITGDLVKQVTAKYTPNGWLVNGDYYDDEATFEVTEDVTIEPDYIEVVIPVEFPSEPTRENYEFIGWYTEETGGEKIEEYNGNEPITLHARYMTEFSKLKAGEEIQSKIFWSASGSFRKATLEEYNSVKDTLTDNDIISIEGTKPTYLWQTGENVLYYSEAETIYMNEDASSIFDSKSLSSIDLSGIDFSMTTNMYSIFRASDATTITLGNINTSNVTNMGSMFGQMSRLTSIDNLSFDTHNVTDMSYMFYDSHLLTELDLSDFDTSSVENMEYMFAGCNSLTSLNISSFETSQVTTMYSMFKYDSALTEINVSDFVTSNVESFSSMFEGCTSLSSIDVTNFDTQNANSLDGMFKDCSLLTTLDLSSFDTQNVMSISEMFSGDTSLETIYVSDAWSTNIIADWGRYDVFSYDENLVGGAGTVFDEEHTNYEYARIDGGVDNPGYLTLKVDQVLPTDFDFDADDIKMVVGQVHQIGVTFTPEGSGDTLTYSNYDDTKISVVDGLITGLSEGTTTITVGTENTDIEKTISITVLSDKLESTNYTVTDKVRPKENEEDPDITDRIIIGAEPGTLISEFKENMLNPVNYIKIYDGDNELSDDDIVKTGLTIRLEINGIVHDEAIIIIRGDINQDGLVNLMDKSVLSEQLLRLSDIEGYGVYAADIDNNDSINLMDKSKLSEYLLRLIDTLNE